MASKSGLIGFSDLLPDSVAADWYADQDTSHFFNPDLPTLDDVSLFQNIFGPPLPSPSFTGEFYPTFSETLLDTQPSQAVRQDIPPSPPDAPGVSSIQPLTTAIPPDYDTMNRGPCYTGVTGVGSWVTSDTRSSIAVPTIPPLMIPSVPSTTTFPFNWIKVPQKNYDHGRKQWSFKRLEPISFSVGGRPGVNMGDALRKACVGLDGQGDPVLQDSGGAISCRFLFSGYPAYGGSCQIHALNWTRKRLPITRGKLAYEVARKLERYLRYMTKFTPDESVEALWTIGQGFMHIDNMFLVRLVSVSRGSFQPEIWVVDPSMPRVRVDWE